VAVLSGSLIFLTERCARLLYLPRRPDLFAEAPLGESGIDMDLLPTIGTGVTLKRNVCEHNFFRSACNSRHAPGDGTYLRQSAAVFFHTSSELIGGESAGW